MTNKRAREIISNSRFGKQFDFYTPDDDREMEGITFATEELAEWVLNLIDKDTVKAMRYHKAKAKMFGMPDATVYKATCPTCKQEIVYATERNSLEGEQWICPCGQKVKWTNEERKT